MSSNVAPAHGVRLESHFDFELSNMKEDSVMRPSFRRKDMVMSKPTINVRHAAERGVTEFCWLSSHHSFSFGHYFDPEHLGFRALRVINDDRVPAGHGSGTHRHCNMEIISIVVEGALEHRDSLGTGSVIRPGEAQWMSGGAIVQHSEFNTSPTDEVRFLQIWIEPERSGLEPGYEQPAFPLEDNRNGWTPLDAGECIAHQVENGRHAWIQVISGGTEVNGR
jgi:redox-sensitive bicupin YhaK (pirin superfamily)